MRILIALVVVLFISSNIIQNNSVDGVKIGMTISDFLDVKGEIYQVEHEVINIEGDDSSIFNVYDNSKLIYSVEPDASGEKIWRIWLYGKKFKTSLGIGVGNTLGDLKKKYTIEEIYSGEGNLAVLVKEIKVSFLL